MKLILKAPDVAKVTWEARLSDVAMATSRSCQQSIAKEVAIFDNVARAPFLILKSVFILFLFLSFFGDEFQDGSVLIEN